MKRGGLAVVDRRTQVGRALAEKRSALVQHVGGSPSVVVRDAIEDYLTLGLFIGAGVAALHRLGHVNRRRNVYRDLVTEVRALIRDRHAIGKDLGWNAQVREVPSVSEAVALAVAEARAAEVKR